MWLGVLIGLCGWGGVRGAGRLTAFLLGLNTPFLVMMLKALGIAMSQGLSVSEERSTPAGTSDDAAENPSVTSE